MTYDSIPTHGKVSFWAIKILGSIEVTMDMEEDNVVRLVAVVAVVVAVVMAAQEEWW